MPSHRRGPLVRRCGEEGRARDSLTRELAHEPFGRPTTLLVTIRCYRCAGCARVWRQDLSNAAEPRAKLSRSALQWALKAIVCQHLTVARVAEALAVSWNTANNAVLAEGRRVLIADPARFDGVAVIGVDEHVWRHTRRGDRYVTVIIDLTPIRDGTGPARLLDMVEGRSKQAFKTWLAARPKEWRANVEVVAMDGFTGYKTAAAEQLPEATPVNLNTASAEVLSASVPQLDMARAQQLVNARQLTELLDELMEAELLQVEAQADSEHYHQCPFLLPLLFQHCERFVPGSIALSSASISVRAAWWMSRMPPQVRPTARASSSMSPTPSSRSTCATSCWSCRIGAG